MSVCIDVIPSLTVVPTLGELERAVEDVIREQRLHPVVAREWGLLEGSGPKVDAHRQDVESEANATECDRGPDASLMMEGRSYGSLSILALQAGFDFYFCGDDEEYPHRSFVDECAKRAHEIGSLRGFPFEDAAAVGHRWMMRLSAGQPMRTRILAGFAAAALARLTDGFLFSDDGGLDYERAPTDSEDFLSWYVDWLEALAGPELTHEPVHE